MRGGRRAATACALATVALTMSACATRQQFGVPTKVDPVAGNCDTSRNVEVGATLDLSGPGGAQGHEYLTGLRLAMKTVNGSQGVLKNHTCLELLYKDDKGDPRTADRAVLDLVNDEVVKLLVGPEQSQAIRTAGADLGLAGVPTTDVSSLDDIRQPKPSWPMMFPTGPAQSTVSRVIAGYARSQGWSSVAVAAVNDPAGQQGLADLKTALGGEGIAVAASIRVPTTGGDASSALEGMKAVSPSALVFTGDTAEAAGAVLKARAAAGWDVPLIGGSQLSDAVALSDVAGGVPHGVTVVVPSAVVLYAGQSQPQDPSMVHFLSALGQEVGSLTGSVVSYAEAYDGLAMLAYATNSANSVNPGNVRTFLENANYQGLLASYSYTSSRHGGVVAGQLTTAPLDSLPGGLFHTNTPAPAATSP
ncbi:MAG TPA: ABC transporter substrate-binding protein [Acidimicrobiales bacterium]|nr:ABC transporter substrate-binding protein [Acidimicrobiales bacterium]